MPWTAHISRTRSNRCCADPAWSSSAKSDDEDKNELLGDAAALLFPIDWPEPFGLVMIEAMACGTPVIAWDNGSVREMVDDGVTGFIVDSIEAAVAAVDALGTLDRQRVSRDVRAPILGGDDGDEIRRIVCAAARPASAAGIARA